MSNRYELSNVNTEKNKVTLSFELKEADLFNKGLPQQVELVMPKDALKDLLGASTEVVVEEKSSASKKSK